MSAVKIFPKDTFLKTCLLFIIIIYIGLYLFEVYVINIDGHWQFINKPLLYLDFWGSILYFHANPPGLSVIHYLIDKISFGHKYDFLEILNPFFHFSSLYFFYRALQFVDIPYSKTITALLFFNPLIFIYFKYPFYPTLLFITSCTFLYVLFSPTLSNNRKLLLLTLILSFNSFTRASWHIIIIIAFVIPFMVKANVKYVVISILILCVPLGVYLKNYVLFGKFTSSTWSGFNFARVHIRENAPNKTVSIIPVFLYGTSVKPYESFMDPTDPLLRQYASVPILNQDDLNNIYVIRLSDLYMQDVKNNFQLKHSLREILKGFFQFMESPSAYFIFHQSGIVNPNPTKPPYWFKYDIFDLPMHVTAVVLGKTMDLKFSVYTIIYPLVFILLLLFFKQLKFEQWYIFLLTLLFSALYSSIDPLESNRMRFEIEPYFYFLTALCVKLLINNKSRLSPSAKKVNMIDITQEG